MTKDAFRHLLTNVRVQLVAGGPRFPQGLFLTGITQDELAELVTMAGQQCGEVPLDAKVNPEYLALGPEANMELQFHPEVCREIADEGQRA